MSALCSLSVTVVYASNMLLFFGPLCRYGAKLTNVFSKAFTVETFDAVTKQKYKQKWRNNMMDRSEPVVRQAAKSRAKPFTKITYTPDLARFGKKICSHCDLAVLDNFDRRGGCKSIVAATAFLH